MTKAEIRQQLKDSLDMVHITFLLSIIAIVVLIEAIIVLFMPQSPYEPSKWILFALMAAISALPFLIFCACRTIAIFRRPESYHFCKATLCNPTGGRIRDSIRFLVVLEDADGCKFTAYTHSIFQTRRSSLGLALEDYIHREVTIGYNEETGQVVVIG